MGFHALLTDIHLVKTGLSSSDYHEFSSSKIGNESGFSLSSMVLYAANMGSSGINKTGVSLNAKSQPSLDSLAQERVLVHKESRSMAPNSIVETESADSRGGVSTARDPEDLSLFTS